MLISRAENGRTRLMGCPHLLEKHQVEALLAQRVPDEPDPLLPSFAQVADGPARKGWWSQPGGDGGLSGTWYWYGQGADWGRREGRGKGPCGDVGDKREAQGGCLGTNSKIETAAWCANGGPFSGGVGMEGTPCPPHCSAQGLMTLWGLEEWCDPQKKGTQWCCQGGTPLPVRVSPSPPAQPSAALVNSGLTSS